MAHNHIASSVSLNYPAQSRFQALEQSGQGQRVTST